MLKHYFHCVESAISHSGNSTSFRTHPMIRVSHNFVTYRESMGVSFNVISSDISTMIYRPICIVFSCFKQNGGVSIPLIMVHWSVLIPTCWIIFTLCWQSIANCCVRVFFSCCTWTSSSKDSSSIYVLIEHSH